MINIIIGIAKDIRKLFSYVSELPLPNRIGSYALIFIGFVVGILSLIFCVFALWVLITIIFDGSLFDNPPAEDWDIR